MEEKEKEASTEGVRWEIRESEECSYKGSYGGSRLQQTLAREAEEREAEEREVEERGAEEREAEGREAEGRENRGEKRGK